MPRVIPARAETRQPTQTPPDRRFLGGVTTVAKPRQLQLLGGQLVAVDENQTARIERHRPSPRGANYAGLTDIHGVPRQIAEILDDSAAISPSVPG